MSVSILGSVSRMDDSVIRIYANDSRLRHGDFFIFTDEASIDSLVPRIGQLARLDVKVLEHLSGGDIGEYSAKVLELAPIVTNPSSNILLTIGQGEPIIVRGKLLTIDKGRSITVETEHNTTSSPIEILLSTHSSQKYDDGSFERYVGKPLQEGDRIVVSVVKGSDGRLINDFNCPIFLEYSPTLDESFHKQDDEYRELTDKFDALYSQADYASMRRIFGRIRAFELTQEQLEHSERLRNLFPDEERPVTAARNFRVLFYREGGIVDVLGDRTEGLLPNEFLTELQPALWTLKGYSFELNRAFIASTLIDKVPLSSPTVVEQWIDAFEQILKAWPTFVDNHSDWEGWDIIKYCMHALLLDVEGKGVNFISDIISRHNNKNEIRPFQWRKLSARPEFATRSPGLTTLIRELNNSLKQLESNSLVFPVEAYEKLVKSVEAAEDTLWDTFMPMSQSFRKNFDLFSGTESTKRYVDENDLETVWDAIKDCRSILEYLKSYLT